MPIEVPIEGVDYAGSRPSPAGLYAAGKRFVVRYGGPGGDWKHITAAEASALRAAGLSIVANAEGAASGLVNGFAAGASWAREADQHFRGLGMPADRPIYLSVDFDTDSGDWTALDAAMDGAASVIGRGRVGVYGEYSIVDHFVRNGKARWYWQTYAWSGGRWHPRNHIEQYRNGVTLAGGTVDLDRAMVADYGQWGQGEVDDVELTATEKAQLRRADVYGYSLVTGRTETLQIPDETGQLVTLPVVPNIKLAELEEKVAELAARPPVQSAPVDPAALKAVLLDPAVLAAIGEAVVDEDHRRSAG